MLCQQKSIKLWGLFSIHHNGLWYWGLTGHLFSHRGHRVTEIVIEPQGAHMKIVGTGFLLVF